MGKFLISATAKGYVFRLVAANGQAVATSEVYETLAACRAGAESVRTCAPAARFADLTQPGRLPANPRFELYQDRAGRYRFRLKARNGKIIAVSEGYSTWMSCENGIESVRKNAADGEIREE